MATNLSFQEAGEKAVLSTLWETSATGDTVKFMESFYQRFLTGMPAQQALQATQEEFIQTEDYNNPYFWAGFTITGVE